MNHPVSQVVGQLLVTAVLGKWVKDTSRTEADWQVSYGANELPDEGDYAIGLSDVEGENENKRSMRSGEPSIRPGVTLQIRAPTDQEAVPKAWEVAAHLDALSCRAVVVPNVVTGGTNTYRVQNFTRKYDPAFLHEEEREGRRVWVFRGLVTITQES